MMSKLLYLISIFSFLSLLFLFQPQRIESALNTKFFLNPASASASLGSSLEVVIRLNAGGEKVNSAAAFLTFPPDLLEGEITTTNSFASFFSQKEVDNKKGNVKVNGASTDPVSGENLLLANLSFKVKKTGRAEINFTDQSVVYKGSSNVLGSTAGGVYTLTSVGQPSPTATSSAIPSVRQTTTPSATASALPKAGTTESTIALLIVSLSALTLGLLFKKYAT